MQPQNRLMLVSHEINSYLFHLSFIVCKRRIYHY